MSTSSTPKAIATEQAPAPEPEARPMTREQRRSKRKRAVRASTISIKRMTKREIELGRLLYPADEERAPRPRVRADCMTARIHPTTGLVGPCPYVSCEYHLYLDVNPTSGAIKLNFPDLEPDQLTESCVLDVADRGGATLEEVGAIMNITRERIRQIEVLAMARASETPEAAVLEDFADKDARPVRRLPVLQDQDTDTDVDALDDFDLALGGPGDPGELDGLDDREAYRAAE